MQSLFDFTVKQGPLAISAMFFLSSRNTARPTEQVTTQIIPIYIYLFIYYSLPRKCFYNDIINYLNIVKGKATSK